MREEQRFQQPIIISLWFRLLVISLMISSSTALGITGSERNSSSDINCIRNGQHVCLTKGCVKAAAKIISMMDSAADPCVDFERFACGTYLDNAIIPDTELGVDQRSPLKDKINHNIRRLLEEHVTDEDTEATNMVKTYYSTCMNADGTEILGMSPLQDILAILGGWPVVEGENWDPAIYQWTHNLYRNKQLGYSYDRFFNLGFGSDIKNSSWRILQISQGSTYMLREDLLKGFNDSKIQAYYEYQLGMAELLGADRERAERELKEVIEFEADIAKILLPPEELHNTTALYNKITVNDLEILVPDIPWIEYINGMVSPYFEVSASEPIVVSSTDVLKKMSTLINTTPKRIVANFIIWEVVRNSVTPNNKAARELEFEFFQKVYGIVKETPRWESCVNSVRYEMAVGSHYVRKYFDEDAKSTTEEMIGYIHESFNDKLQRLEWLDDSTKKRALQKSKSIHSVIAYPIELLNDLKVSEYYDGLIITKGNVLEQSLNLTKFKKQKILKNFRTKVDKRDWRNYGNPTKVGAKYVRSANTIVFLAGILQGIFFDSKRPMYLNFGGIGSAIGHEIIHGFDDEGKQYDANGEFHNWWERETERKYLEKAQCFIEQYENFTIPEIGLNVNGKLTLGENIADNGGTKDAYYGYKKWVNEHEEEPLLPGLPYTQSQLFWIANANNWCGKSRPEALRKRVLTNPHSPNRFRINGQVMNNEDFSRDFNCPVGVPMNPINKCEVW